MPLSLLGLTLSFSKNGKYVKKEECHKAHAVLTKYLDEKFADTNKRIDDFMNSVNNYVSLLKK
jgi:hypothetical protein